ncbi:glycosyltransferase family 4 protein [Patescibacteria group bacterium]|nr:glycosyltransferase family 4 protein [Patescibacteria group bacterium]
MKRRILMITPYLPCRSQSGGQTRSFFQIKHLSLQNEITLICFTRDQKGLEELKQYCSKVIIIKRGKTWDLKKILLTGFSTYPFLVTNYLSDELQSKIREELSQTHYDLIHTECFYLMPNIPQTDIPIMLVDQTIEFAVYQHYVETIHGFKKLFSFLLWFDVFKIKYWESYYWKKTDYIAAVSEEDRLIMSQLSSRKDIQIVPNGVDDQYFQPKTKVKKTVYPSILFGISNMKWMQNSEGANLLLRDIWPSIKAKIPTARLFIIGRFAPATFDHVQDPNVIIKEAANDGLPNDPRSYYQKSWILLAPIKSGGGSRTKFFEAMACKLPVLTTKQGMEGINIQNDHDAIVCDYNELTQNAVKLLTDSQLRETIGTNAQLLVKEFYSWAKSANTLNNIYENITQ